MTSATSSALEPRFLDKIAADLGVRSAQVRAAADLFADGSTVPFVARYRKEVTGGLDDEQLEAIAKERTYFLELAARRDAVLAAIDEQGKLTPELEAALRGALTKQELEDLYLPYKKKRRTRAQIARERGLEPLADALLEGASGGDQPAALAAPHVSAEKDVPDTDAALAGARDILAERLAEDAAVRSALRRALAQGGVLRVRGVSGQEGAGAVYRDYFDHSEPVGTVPSHRLLAILRGEREGFLLSDLELDDEERKAAAAASWGVPLTTPCGREVAAASEDGYKRLLRPSVTNEVRSELTERAEAEAIAVFRANLEALLLQSPLGRVPVLGVDPGLRTGAKVAVVDAIGKVVGTAVIYPIPPRARPEEAAAKLLELARRHEVRAVAVGNGTGSRETEVFVRRCFQEAGKDAGKEAGYDPQEVVVAIVPETGASVYSASAVAREELPDLDVALRGAVSIARRLQDPLAELVKIDPKSLGVGQYQHDVDQRALARELDLAVEGAVNRVGVELNTASAPLLTRVSGLTERLARAVVEHRESRGPFPSRKSLLQVGGFGPKTFEQSAGFLRIGDGAEPLDRTGVHPERYPVVEAMARALEVEVGELVGSPQLAARLDLSRFEDSARGVGRFTLEDIREELERPGRDPRPDFETPEWREDVTSIDDLSPGMVLEGRVSNVTNFGAFVDLGVKRDGLVHLSEMADRWVDDPREIVQVGQIVQVRVTQVDRERGRIGLSMKSGEGQGSGSGSGSGKGKGKGQGGGAGGGGTGKGKGRGGHRSARPSSKKPAGRAEGPAPGQAAPRPATVDDLVQKFGGKRRR